jgi:microcystin-dependent protein
LLLARPKFSSFTTFFFLFMPQQPYLGELMIFAGNFAPRGWAMCNGQLLSIQQNAALFSLLGTFYGGNGTSNFQLPDLRGRVPVHQGTLSGGGTYVMGMTGGVESVILTSNQLPPHVHSVTGSPTSASSQPATQTDPEGHVFAVPTDGSLAYSPTAVGAATTAAAGLNQAHSNLQPYLSLTICSATAGIFPSRN